MGEAHAARGSRSGSRQHDAAPLPYVWDSADVMVLGGDHARTHLDLHIGQQDRFLDAHAGADDGVWADANMWPDLRACPTLATKSICRADTRRQGRLAGVALRVRRPSARGDTLAGGWMRAVGWM